MGRWGRTRQAGWVKSGIVDARVIDGGQGANHRLANGGEFFQREITFIKLAVADNRVDNF